MVEFSGEIIVWRGPAPYLFVALPEAESARMRAAAAHFSYGWGVIPVEVRLGSSIWRTALMPKDGRYLVPIRVSVQRAEQVGPGMSVRLQLEPVPPARRR